MPEHDSDPADEVDLLEQEKGWTAQSAAVGEIRVVPEVASKMDGFSSDFSSGNLWVQLRDSAGRELFDIDGRPVMVRRDRHSARTPTRALYAILYIIVAILVVYGILAIVGLVELHHLSTTTTSFDSP